MWGVNCRRAASQDRKAPKRRGDGGGVRREGLAWALHAARGRPVAVRGRPRPRGRIVASPANHTPRSGKRDSELSLGRRGDRPLAGRARGLRADLRPPRRHRAPLPGPPGGRRSRGGAGRRAVPDRVRAAQDVRRVARERAAVAVRDRLEPVAEAPARRGSAAARERPDGGADEATDRRASAGALDARLLFPRVADAIEALPDGEREALLLFAWEDLSYQSVAEALELPIGTVRSRLNRARARCANCSSRAGKKGEVAMKPVDLARKLRREAAFEPAALDRGKERAHGGNPAGGRAQAPTDDRSPDSVSGHRRRALVPGARVRVPRDPDRAAREPRPA